MHRDTAPPDVGLNVTFDSSVWRAPDEGESEQGEEENELKRETSAVESSPRKRQREVEVRLNVQAPHFLISPADIVVSDGERSL
jgi:hypothetical protein